MISLIRGACRPCARKRRRASLQAVRAARSRPRKPAEHPLVLCEEGVQDVLTLFCGGVAQTCHDDRVVELKEQLVVEEEEDGEGQEGKVKEEGRGRVKGECTMDMTVDDKVFAQDLSQ